MTTIKQQLIANHLSEYLEIRKADNLSFSTNSDFDDTIWTKFFKKSKHLTESTEKYFHSKTSIDNDIVLSFHDGFFKNIQANPNENTFTVSILTHQFDILPVLKRRGFPLWAFHVRNGWSDFIL